MYITTFKYLIDFWRKRCFHFTEPRGSTEHNFGNTSTRKLYCCE
jgi:hypothetical protein